MSVRAALWIALAAAPLAGVAQPAADPVIANFREYRAALERGDFVAAETAAAAALAASEAAKGPRTAVLALNLANLRLNLGGDRDALTPARTAHSLATGSNSGVDPVAAALALGRAEITTGDKTGEQRLLAAFAAAADKPELEADVYDAAVTLGDSAFEAREYPTARSAWETAARLAHTAGEPDFARARALTGLGAAIFLASNDRSLVPEGGAAPTSTADAQAANEAFAEAQRLLVPAALALDLAPELTAGKAAFAQAMAWQDALIARMRSNGEELPPIANARIGPEGACRMRVVAEPQPTYPGETLDRYGVGAVVVHIGLDPSGAIVSRALAAAIPPGPLGDAVMAVAGQWRVEKDPVAPADCRIPPSVFPRVQFVLE